jgi:hypothetical protein
MTTLQTGLCPFCGLLINGVASQMQVLPEGTLFCHDECYEFFKASRPEPLRRSEESADEDSST